MNHAFRIVVEGQDWLMFASTEDEKRKWVNDMVLLVCLKFYFSFIFIIFIIFILIFSENYFILIFYLGYAP